MLEHVVIGAASFLGGLAAGWFGGEAVRTVRVDPDLADLADRFAVQIDDSWLERSNLVNSYSWTGADGRSHAVAQWLWFYPKTKDCAGLLNLGKTMDAAGKVTFYSQQVARVDLAAWKIYKDGTLICSLPAVSEAETEVGAVGLWSKNLWMQPSGAKSASVSNGKTVSPLIHQL